MIGPPKLIIVLMELLLILLAFILPFFLVLKSFQQMLNNNRENIRLRLEVRKLADDLEKARMRCSDPNDRL